MIGSRTVQLREGLLSLSLVVGVCLVGVGVLVVDGSRHSLDVLPATNESELQDDIRVVEYDRLEPDLQDVFREAQANGYASISEPPDFDDVYVHYQDAYYRTFPTHGDGRFPARELTVISGIVLVTIGGLGTASSRLTDRQSGS